MSGVGAIGSGAGGQIASQKASSEAGMEELKELQAELSQAAEQNFAEQEQRVIGGAKEQAAVQEYAAQQQAYEEGLSAGVSARNDGLSGQDAVRSAMEAGRSADKVPDSAVAAYNEGFRDGFGSEV